MGYGATRPSAADFKMVEEGPYAAVRISPDAYGEYEKLFASDDNLSKKRRVHLKRYFDRFCQLGPKSLNEEKFKFEDNLPDGTGKHVSIYAFKPFKWRLYGGILTVAGKRTFVGVRVDPSKKQDKANQTLLRSAAIDIAGLHEYGA